MIGELIHVDFARGGRVLDAYKARDFIKKLETVLCEDDMNEFHDATIYHSVYLTLDPEMRSFVDQYQQLLEEKE